MAKSNVRFTVVVIALAAVLRSTEAEAVSFGVEGQPVVYEEQGKICFRVEKYVYSHSVISFLESTRDIDTEDVQLLDVLVGGEERHWSIAHKDQPQTGMRLRKTTSICYGVAPAGFVTTDEAEPLVGGRYTVLMDAREGDNSLRFTDDFCLSEERHVVSCYEERRSSGSFLRQLFGWLFGG